MYAVKAFDGGILEPHKVKMIERIMWIIVGIQAILIIALRNHYTADVIVGAYITPLLWHFLNDLVLPNDDEDIK
jgi:hypothetical protein